MTYDCVVEGVQIADLSRKEHTPQSLWSLAGRQSPQVKMQ